MADAVNPQVVDSVTIANAKTVAEMGAWATAQVMSAHAQVVQDHVAHRARLNILAEKFLATSVKAADEVDPEQAAATLKLLTGNDLGQVLSSLGTAVAQIQQLMKGAQSTPPETATGK